MLCLVNYKQAIAELCMCAHLDACLSDVQRPIWRSWYDPVQRTMVKSALIDLDIQGKVGSHESSLKQKTTEL